MDLDYTLFNRKLLGETTASEEAIKTALSWIETCANKHGQCRNPSTFLPTRLVCVGSGPASDPEIRLVQGKDLPRDSRYLTLSHCWGGYMPERLSTTNIEDFGQQIPFNTLSQTFQDAILVTRELNHQYIWIDSLCIIQDNLSDWHSESSQMGEIYTNSYCNLSASASKDGTQGLFRYRNPYMNRLEQLPLKIYRDYPRQLFPLWDTSTWFDNIERSPLNLRGWVCQERFMSPCNLHFGMEQLFWECKNFSACESFPRGFSRRIGKIDPADTKEQISKSVGIHHDTSDNHAKVWDTLLGNYTGSKVSFAQDKLIAFAGLAAVWAKFSNDEYLAGLWRSRLPRDLLWYTSHPRNDNEHPEYVAPSWSWASMDGEVTWFEDEVGLGLRPLIEIISAHVEQAKANPFGQVKSGSISLAGNPARCQWNESENRLEIRTNSGSESLSDLEVYWDRPHDIRMKQSCFNQELLYLLPVAEGLIRRGGMYIWGPAMQGLILQRMNIDSVMFMRHGLFRATYGSWNMKSADKRFAQSPECAGLDTIIYDGGKEGYVITLI